MRSSIDDKESFMEAFVFIIPQVIRIHFGKWKVAHWHHHFNDFIPIVNAH
jgi:hypothetical protein